MQRWDPLSPEEIAEIFSEAAFSWWIAGGYAIEHFVGRSLRPHDDIDVQLFAADHSSIQSLLADWDCWLAAPPGMLRPWAIGETPPLSVSDVWCRENERAPWRFQLMLDQRNGPVWQSRRCALVSKPIVELTSRSTTGIPFLIPEVQLFYKARGPRPKDELDFAAALPSLSDSQIAWLHHAISVAYSVDNAWLSILVQRSLSCNSRNL